jgi:biotin carboxyl carrier protein
MPQKIYRQEALERLSSPDQFDQLMPLTSPRGWIALAAAGLLLLVAGLWAVLGTITVTVEGEGLLTRSGARTVQAPETGKVKAVDAKVGNEVRAGEPLLQLSVAPGKERTVPSPFHGRVLAVAAGKGDDVQKGAALVTVEPLDVPLEAVIFVPAAEGYQVEPGQHVRVVPGLGKSERTTHLRGEVKSASRYPASREAITRALNSEALADQVSRAGPVLEVVVEVKDGSGVYSGTPCRANIVVDRKRPISLVLPFDLHSGGRQDG